MQLVGLLTFLALSTQDERPRVWMPLAIAEMYFLLTVASSAGHAHLQIYQWLCAIAGMVAAAAPLLTFRFLVCKSAPFCSCMCTVKFVCSLLSPVGVAYLHCRLRPPSWNCCLTGRSWCSTLCTVLCGPREAG